MEQSREPMNKNRIQGDPDQGERAFDCEAFVTKERGRRSGGCAAKDRVLTRGDLALRLKGRRSDPEREVSRSHSSCPHGAKGRTRRRVDRLWDSKAGTGTRHLGTLDGPRKGAVKPRPNRDGVKPLRRPWRRRLRETSTCRTARCGPACRGGVGGDRSVRAAPIPIYSIIDNFIPEKSKIILSYDRFLCVERSKENGVS